MSSQLSLQNTGELYIFMSGTQRLYNLFYIPMKYSRKHLSKNFGMWLLIETKRDTRALSNWSVICAYA